MKTPDLIDRLVADGGAVRTHLIARRYALGLGAGVLAAALLMAIALGVRPDLQEAARTPMFWLKWAFPASLAVASLVASLRLARPGARLGHVPVALVVPLALVWLVALVELATAAPIERTHKLLGDSWRECPVNIAILAAPVFLGAFWAMRGLAPTRLVLAGAASGLLAGAVGALVYALHCTEMAAPFLGLWYVAGMLIPASIGALLGPRLLRW
jgi:hypothetical protein